jgi:hypothetical protein
MFRPCASTDGRLDASERINQSFVLRKPLKRSIDGLEAGFGLTLGLASVSEPVGVPHLGQEAVLVLHIMPGRTDF